MIPDARGVEAIAIGASAGGLDALEVVLPALDVRCVASVLVVVHVQRRRPSLLEGLFAPRCALPIREALDKQPLRGGAIYFAPPDYHLLVDRDAGDEPSLALSIDEPVLFSRPSIDVLLESAAECWQQRVMGVVLSGASEDGVRGLGAIAAAGGITLAQDPATAPSPTLPAAAIRSGHVQHVLSLPQMAQLFATAGCAP
jgi:two-component system chemotaxis response regulator CheB